MDRRVAGGPRGVAFAAAFVLAALLAAACTGSPNPPPTTTVPPTSPTTRPPPTADQLRCLAEGAFLVDAGTQLSRIVLAEGTSPGDSDEQQALTAAQSQLDRLRRRSVHEPYVADREKLIADAANIIAGNQGLLGRGNHAQRRKYYLQVTGGGNEALAHAADVQVKRSGCAPSG